MALQLLSLQREEAHPPGQVFGDLRSERFTGNALLRATAQDRARVGAGSDTDAVQRIQQALVDVGPLTGKVYNLGTTGAAENGVDGVYGSKTGDAVRAFKSDQHLGFTHASDVGPRTIHRLDDLLAAPAPPKPRGMTVAAFRTMMQTRWGVKTIRAGTFEEQEFGGLKRSEWRPWVFDDSSPIYAATVEAFERLSASFGGIPPVDTIVFFQTSYKRVGGQAVADPSVGASFDRDRTGQGNLVIYAAVITANTLPTTRREKGSQKPPREGTPDKFTATLRNITHELGHGIEQNVAAIRDGQAGPDSALMDEYMKVSGWLLRPGNTVEPFVLYDSGDTSVAKAIAANPPDTAVLAAKPHITSDNFELPWKEQPITSYMVNSPSEDFAEAIMGYLNKPDLLRARAPRRFRFIDQHKSRWLSRLRQPKP